MPSSDVALPDIPSQSIDTTTIDTTTQGRSALNVTTDSNYSTATVTQPRYINENGEYIKIVRMRQEEIINCLCGYGEEDGLMIQCELCMCWQHSTCNNIEKESEVPDKYVCAICLNPYRGRESMRYIHDQDWLFDGKLPVADYQLMNGKRSSNPKHTERFDQLKQSHVLTGNLLELKRFMNSLKVKINIAANKDHPKMYLWSKRWETSPQRSVDKMEFKNETDEDVKDVQMGDVKSECDKVHVEDDKALIDVKKINDGK